MSFQEPLLCDNPDRFVLFPVPRLFSRFVSNARTCKVDPKRRHLANVQETRRVILDWFADLCLAIHRNS